MNTKSIESAIRIAAKQIGQDMPMPIRKAFVSLLREIKSKGAGSPGVAQVVTVCSEALNISPDELNETQTDNTHQRTNDHEAGDQDRMGVSSTRT
jgi:hypothetical protein